MKILLTGANGQLGRCFQDCIPIGWNILATDSNKLDITSREQVQTVVETFQPDVIVNAAAYTAVDKAESEPEIASLVNKIGPQNLALEAKKVGSRFVHVSTDYVFDGRAIMPYVETDETNPLSVYGKTKLDGEIAVSNILQDAIIIRTAWVFSEYGNNFVKTMLRLGKERDELSVVCDQRGCPTYAGDIAQAIIGLLRQDAGGGIYHFSGGKEMTWSEFAEKIFKVAIETGKLDNAPLVKKITTEQYPTAAHRPAYSSLSNLKISAFVSPSNWKEVLRKVITA
ncbi:dTDP-4-dehydrorhamnose reductase [Sodalis sp. RH16]|uniref:dTDP-4-dehydrorhamnose reductase n=1 Tax=Sodalis sp. RH16 TaxID=3394331 RepID=UPI0039B524B0